MGVWNEVFLSDLRGNFRLDAEFWEPAAVETEEKIRSVDNMSLGDISKSVRKGIFYILASE